MIVRNKHGEEFKIQGAVFDKDGTIFDTEGKVAENFKEISKEVYGKEMTDKLLVDSLGLAYSDAKILATKVMGHDFPYETIRGKVARKLEEQFNNNEILVKDGAIEALRIFKGSGIPCAIATSSNRKETEYQLAEKDLNKYFSGLVCGDDSEVALGKPMPHIFIEAARKIKTEPTECIAFEDSEPGAKSAIRAGMKTVFIQDMKQPSKEISELIFMRIDSMREIVSKLEE